MDMPTPCPDCGEIVEFTMMQNIDGTLVCEDCASEHLCEDCGYYSIEVGPTEHGNLCNTCYRDAVDMEEQDFEE